MFSSLTRVCMERGATLSTYDSSNLDNSTFDSSAYDSSTYDSSTYDDVSAMLVNESSHFDVLAREMLYMPCVWTNQIMRVQQILYKPINLCLISWPGISVTSVTNFRSDLTVRLIKSKFTLTNQMKSKISAMTSRAIYEPIRLSYHVHTRHTIYLTTVDSTYYFRLTMDSWERNPIWKRGACVQTA